jgi:hypothetical protein
MTHNLIQSFKVPWNNFSFLVFLYLYQNKNPVVEHAGKSTREGTRRRQRTKEARKWDEGSSGEVEGNGDPHSRGFSQDQSDIPLKISQADRTKGSKLIRLLMCL